MSPIVWLAANTLDYPDGAGHQWVYLNWALGLRTLGCQVVWLEGVDATRPPSDLRALLAKLRERLERYGLTDGIALCSRHRRATHRRHDSRLPRPGRKRPMQTCC